MAYIAICAWCGYQWDETATSTFELNCPACEANNVRKYAPEAVTDVSDIPWF